jgi:SM-20-related protein
MPTADDLASLGLFVVRDFLDSEFCARCRQVALAAPSAPSLVARAGVADTLDEKLRQSVEASVPAATLATVETRLAALMPELERHFLISLRSCQPPKFLIYRIGDMFQPHQDRGASTDMGQDAARASRQVSAVIFLNGHADEGEESFSGGYLTLYGLGGAPSLPLPLIAAPGLLVAFRSDLIHAVTPVTRGMRHTIVGFFA